MNNSKNKNKILLVGKTYYINPINLGDTNDGIKGKRPILLLTGINNEWIFGIISTTTFSTGKKNTFQNKKYIKFDNGKSGLRLDLQYGWTVMKKNEIKFDTKNLRNSILISQKQKEELLKFYSSIISSEKRRINDVSL